MLILSATTKHRLAKIYDKKRFTPTLLKRVKSEGIDSLFSMAYKSGYKLQIQIVPKP